MPPKSAVPNDGKGRGLKGAGKGAAKGGRKGEGRASGAGADAVKRLQDLEGGSVEAESNFEILRAQRAAARKGRTVIHDSVRENEGVDEDDPLMSVDDGIRLEPFNMRREMKEGHFDESGFYVLNKDEEKKVTDAWLDTVDQAEKRATFQQVERQKKAGNTAANRISALAKNLGPDSEGEDEDEEGAEDGAKDVEDKQADEAKKKAAEEQKAEEEAEEPKEAENDIAMLEELISYLRPLEKPAEALARWARGGGTDTLGNDWKPALEPLKTRARLRQQKAEAVAKASGAGTAQGLAATKQKKRKFNEWGYEEQSSSDHTPAVGSSAEPKQSPSEDATVPPTETGANAVQPAAAVIDEAFASMAEKSTVTSKEAVARAAEKAAAEDKAAKEAAAAFAAEMKISRHALHTALQPEQGPEAASLVNLNSEETRDVREAALPKVPEDTPSDGPPRPAPGNKKRALELSEAEIERRKKIERITDLCDRLLERGVLVYDSTRELLAIDVRQRKGEKLLTDEDAQADTTRKPVEAAAADAKKKASPQEMFYDNKRFKLSPGDAASSVENLESSATASSASDTGAPALLWQYRWTQGPDEVHGPFDSVTMQGWVMQGCFADERPAEVRQCDGQNSPLETCWHRWEKIDFSLYV